METFLILAAVEVFMGFFIYSWFDPKNQRDKNRSFIMKWNPNFDKLFFDLEKDGEFIKKGNKLSFQIFAGSAIVTVINGFLVVKYKFPDVTFILLVVTAILVYPVRYMYIYRLKSRQ